MTRKSGKSPSPEALGTETIQTPNMRVKSAENLLDLIQQPLVPWKPPPTG